MAANWPWRPAGTAPCTARISPGRSPLSLPYAAVFVAFVIYPMGYGLWMGSNPSLYTELFSDPRYLAAAINTVLFVGLAVNVQMFLALLLSGFFARRRRWIKALLDHLHPAMDVAGGSRLPVLPLDAGRRRMGSDRQLVIGVVRHRRPVLVQ